MSEAIVYNCDDERVAAGITALGREALRTASANPATSTPTTSRWASGAFLPAHLHKRFRVLVELQLAGIFNVYNALLAAGVGIALGIGPDAIRRGLEDVRAVPGRIELLETETPYRVILDYAHLARQPGEHLKVCAPDHERPPHRPLRLRRRPRPRQAPHHGRDRRELADLVILTSDNPRNEDPFEILDQIEEGIRHTGCEYT